MVIDKKLQEIKEVKETSNYEEVNALIKEGWILMCIHQVEGMPRYSIGKSEKSAQTMYTVKAQEISMITPDLLFQQFQEYLRYQPLHEQKYESHK